MNVFLDPLLSFFITNMPTWKEILILGPIFLLWAFACLFSAGLMKRRYKLPTGYSRKIFHFLIFVSVATIQWLAGISMVCLFGGMVTLVILYTIVKGSGDLLYDAIAREADAPHATRYILVPYLATLIGGLTSNVIFGPLAIFGYLVTGLGDAVGEPVGTKFGKHIYRTPSLTSVKSVRSLEGSAAVLVMSLVAILLGVGMSPDLQFLNLHFLTIPLLALICTGIEAISPHGWDNLTLQIFPVWLAALML